MSIPFTAVNTPSEMPIKQIKWKESGKVPNSILL